MIELSKTEIATALVLGLTAMDNPPNRKWGEQRSEEDRDAARRLSLHIRSLVDNSTLASICIDVWAAYNPSLIKEGRNYYYGPDVYRTLEIEAGGYPDDSGCDQDDYQEYFTWCERTGQKEQEDDFLSKCLDELARRQEQMKADRAAASKKKRQEKARRQRVINGMMAAATAETSSLMH